MLFIAVRGPELEQIHALVGAREEAGEAMTAAAIDRWFFAEDEDGSLLSNDSANKARRFLVNTGMLIENAGKSGTLSAKPLEHGSFKLDLLARLRAIETGVAPAEDPRDPLYLGIISRVFIAGNRHWADNLLELVGQEMQDIRTRHPSTASIDRTHLYNWSLVCSFLGLGWRAEGTDGGAFYCCYAPWLLQDILRTMPQAEHGEHTVTLYDLFETTLGRFLPVPAQDGSIPPPLMAPLQYLARFRYIRLERTRRDLTAPSYGGFQELTMLRREPFQEFDHV